MYTVLIVIHTLVTLALIAIILVQRNSGDSMGLSGGGGNSFLTGRAAATFVTRATAVLATIFILLSLAIGILTTHNHANNASLIDKIQSKPAAADVKKAAPQPPKPAEPSVPRPQ